MKAFYETRKYDTTLKVWHKTYENIHFVPHWHYELELIFVKKGKAKIYIEGEDIEADEGDLLICDSGLIHHSSPEYMDNELEFLIFDPSIIYTGFEGFLIENPVITKKTLMKHNMYNNLVSLLDEIEIELKKEEAYFKDIVTSSIKKFCFKLSRITQKLGKRKIENRNQGNILSFKVLLDYIEKNYHKNITLRDGAEIMNLSESYFSTLFKEYTGYSFINYINIVRIENAINDLIESQSSITEIALNKGFNNIKTFNRVFKDITGQTPSQVRKCKEALIDIDFDNKRKSSVEYHTSNTKNRTLVRK